MRIKLGEYNTLKVIKEVDFGLYLDAGDEGEVLLPSRYVPKGCSPGDEIQVFLYLDMQERLVATTEEPKAKVGDFAYLNVAWVNEYGAFLFWGPMKDLFCPFSEQKQKMEKGKAYIVHVHLDEESFRIVASAKVERYLRKDYPNYLLDEEVDLLVWQKTDLGFKVIIDNAYQGLVYKNQVFQDVHVGDKIKGYISLIRDDGKIDVTLQPTGRKMTEAFSEKLLEYLESHGGVCHITDKSPAQEIYENFQVSKKTFKKAVGDLYKRRLIEITDSGLILLGD
ncbi:MAG: S1-like domain-containing RNA-binding protein [Prevotella sp.]|nr:S1-like domain-containing RNA-binding protein [Prevotella sp.]